MTQENWDDPYLRTLGVIAFNSGTLESRLRFFIAHLMIKASKSASLVDDTFQLNLALIITSELAFNKLLAMLESLYKQMSTKPERVSELTRLLNKAQAAIEARNQVIHSGWFVSQSKNIYRLKTTAKREKNKPTNLKIQTEKITPNRLADIADLLTDVNEEFELFMRDDGYDITYLIEPIK